MYENNRGGVFSNYKAPSYAPGQSVINNQPNQNQSTIFGANTGAGSSLVPTGNQNTINTNLGPWGTPQAAPITPDPFNPSYNSGIDKYGTGQAQLSMDPYSPVGANSMLTQNVTNTSPVGAFDTPVVSAQENAWWNPNDWSGATESATKAAALRADAIKGMDANGIANYDASIATEAAAASKGMWDNIGTAAKVGTDIFGAGMSYLNYQNASDALDFQKESWQKNFDMNQKSFDRQVARQDKKDAAFSGGK